MNKKRRCLIFCAYMEGEPSGITDIAGSDFVLCADGGYLRAVRAGIRPDLLIGDMDSLKLGEEPVCPVISLPTEKDDTDTMVCVKYAVEKGFGEIIILGGLGGRLDHTFANLQTLSYALDRKKRVTIMDAKNRAFMIEDEEIAIDRVNGFKLSVFAFGGECMVTERGVKYQITDYPLSSSLPLGVSNEFVGEKALISVKKGRLLIVLSKDEPLL